MPHRKKKSKKATRVLSVAIAASAITAVTAGYSELDRWDKELRMERIKEENERIPCSTSDKDLAKAMIEGNLYEFKSALDRGANPNIRTKDGRGLTPLMQIILLRSQSDKSLRMMELLLKDKRTKIDATSTETYETALIMAAAQNNEGAVKLLLDHGADVSATDILGRSALREARDLENKRIIALLEDAMKPTSPRPTVTVASADSTTMDVKRAAPTPSRSSSAVLTFAASSTSTATHVMATSSPSFSVMTSATPTSTKLIGDTSSAFLDLSKVGNTVFTNMMVFLLTWIFLMCLKRHYHPRGGRDAAAPGLGRR